MLIARPWFPFGGYRVSYSLRLERPKAGEEGLMTPSDGENSWPDTRRLGQFGTFRSNAVGGLLRRLLCLFFPLMLVGSPRSGPYDSGAIAQICRHDGGTQRQVR